MYQVWDKDNAGQQNDKRAILYVSGKEWINGFNITNEYLKKNDKPLFTPTTIMETADEVVYAFVIHKAYFDSHDRVVFTVSTKEIQLANNCSKDLIRIPCGKFKNMRFDIDASEDECIAYCAAAASLLGALGFPVFLLCKLGCRETK